MKTTSKDLLKFENKHISSVHSSKISDTEFKIKNLLNKRKKPNFAPVSGSKILKICKEFTPKFKKSTKELCQSEE